MQPTNCQSMLDRIRREPESKKLLPRHQAVLLPHQPPRLL